MSGIYDIEHYVMTCYYSNCEPESRTCLFQYNMLHNESCEREARRTDAYRPQEMAIQAQALANTSRVLPSPACPAGRCHLNFLNLINLKFQVRAPNGCCILQFRPNQVFVRNFI